MTIYDLNLHEVYKEPDFSVMRVPGGWIYRFWDYINDCEHLNAIFVPFDNAFYKSEVSP